MRGLATLGAALALLAVSSPAEAQFFVQTETSSVFVPLSALPGATQVTDFAFSSRDEGRATLTIPFPFRFLGTPQTSVEIGVNGLLVFGGGRFGGYINSAIGSSSSPNDMIAVWWDDLILPNAAGHSSHGVLGTAPNRIFVIEVRDWEHYGLSSINDGRYQVWLYEGVLGRFEVRYDRLLTDTENYTATAGWEGSQGNGTPNGAFRPCSTASPYCTHVDYASMSARVFRVEQAQGPELLGALGDFGRGALPGQSVNVPVNLQNVGTDPASNVSSELYLSTDATLDPATDIRVATFVAPLLAAASSVDLTVAASVPVGTPPGDYYLLLSVDAPNAHTEASEQNNIVAAAGGFATAHELRLVTVDVPVGARAGLPMQVDLTVASEAVPYLGTVQVALRASVDRLLDPRDTDLGRVSLTLTGAPQETLSPNVTLPVTLPPGGYYLFATVDPDGTIGQFDRTNDQAISVTPFPTATDLVPTSVTGPVGAAPGTAIVFDLLVENRGLDHVGLVDVRAIASPDPIYDLNDVVLGQSTVDLTLAPGASRTVQIPVTVPALRAGNYYPILLVDPGRLVPEVSDFNNNRVGDTTFATGPDLTVLDLDGPNEAGVGELVTWDLRVGSIGATYDGAVDFGFYISDDDVYDPQDAFFAGGTVNVGGLADVTQAVTAPFPAVPPGEYWIVARLDPLNALVEADEGNNVFVDPDEIDSGPDFTIFSVNVTPGRATPSDVVTVTGSFRNYGSPYTGPVEYRVFLSEDYQYDPGDIPVHEGVLTLAGETSLTLTTTLTLDAAGVPVPPGEYDVIVVVDPRDLVPERDRYDNEDDSSRDLIVEGPNALVSLIDSAPLAFVGQPYEVPLEIENDGALPAYDLSVAVYLSGVGVLAEGREIGRVTTATLAGGGRWTVTTTVAIPSDTAPGWYLLGTVADPDRQILEVDERDNLRLRPGGLTVMAVASDLIAQITATATSAAPGEPLAITRYVQNIGQVDAPQVGLQYVLSVDDTIGPEDLQIGTASVALSAGQDDLSIDVLDLPGGLPAGRFRLGLRLDPDNLVPEIDETNNAALGPWLTVHEPGLGVLNEVLPTAVVNAEYQAVLYARGATQQVGWSIVQGNLPMGLVLDQVTGEIRGVPREEGRFPFVVQVRSGGPVARRAFELLSVAATVPLSVSPGPLPSPTVGRGYDARVIAVGGQAPYRFSAVTSMPLGLTLAPDGRVQGVPEFAGPQTVRVRVDDALDASASAELTFVVLRADHRVRITQSPLPLARVSADYCDPQPIGLFASGGVPPYRWNSEGPSVPGLELDPEGRLCGTPLQAGRFPLSVRVSDAAGSVDTSLFMVDVIASEAFAVRTTALPDGTPGEPYAASLEVLGAVEPITWAVSIGELPAGLELTNGRIEGTPTAVGTSAFVVTVTDVRGQARRQPLSIRIAVPQAADDGGCRCLGPSPDADLGALASSALLIGLGLLGSTRRRRRA